MWAINTRLLSPRSINDINVSSVCKMVDLIDELKSSNKVFLCNDVWMLDSDPNTCYLDDISDEDIHSQVSDILFKSNLAYCGENTVESIESINLKRLNNSLLGTSFSDIDTRIEEGLFVKKYSDLIRSRRKLFDSVNTYAEFICYVECTFNNLIFHPNSMDEIENLGRFNEIKGELLRHLDALNMYAQVKYDESKRNEVETLRYLESAHGINCSGKGSNETIRFKIDYKGIELNCTPHTKFYNGANDQRIYFSWGRPNLEDGKIIMHPKVKT